MQQGGQLGVPLKRYTLYLCFASCIDYQFPSGSNSKWWFWPLKPFMACSRVIWGISSPHFISPPHYIQQKMHAMSPVCYTWRVPGGGPSLPWRLPYATFLSLPWSESIFIPIDFLEVPQNLIMPSGLATLGNRQGTWGGSIVVNICCPLLDFLIFIFIFWIIIIVYMLTVL